MSGLWVGRAGDHQHAGCWLSLSDFSNSLNSQAGNWLRSDAAWTAIQLHQGLCDMLLDLPLSAAVNQTQQQYMHLRT